MSSVLKPKINPWIVAIVVMLPSCLELLDTGILNVVLPDIAASYGVTTDQSTWALTAYLVASAIVLPISGWFSELFGRKNYFFSNIVVFGLGTIGCFFAPNFTVFLLCRIVQGFSGGGLLPPAQAIIFEVFSESEAQRNMGMAVYGMGLVVAPSLGPFLGGFISSNYHWKDIYMVYFPIIIIGGLLVFFLLPAGRDSAIKKGIKMPIDYLGLAFLTVGLGSLQVFLSNGQKDNWFQSPLISVLFALTVISLIGLIYWESHTKDPLIKLDIFKIKNVSSSLIVMFVVGLLIYGINLIIPEYLQALMGYSAQDAGKVVSMAALFSLIAMPLAGILATRLGYKKLIILGLFLTALATFLMSRFAPNMSGLTPFQARMIMSFSLGFIMVPLNTAAIAFVTKPQDYDNISGMLNLSRSIGGSMGIAIIQTVIARTSQAHQTYLSAHINQFNGNFTSMLHSLTSGGLSQPQAMSIIYQKVVQQAYALAYSDAFMVCCYITLALIPVAFILMKDKKIDKLVMGH